MMIIEGEVHIQRAPREVFDFLGDTDRWAEIDAALVRSSVTGRAELGTRGKLIHRRPGTKVTTDFEVTGFEPPKRFEVTITGIGYELRETVLLEAVDEGTLVRVTDVLEPTSLVGRVLVAISGRTVRRDLEARRAKLKAVLEAAA
jgi:carbon monoxide dehydrogenase subunit G